MNGSTPANFYHTLHRFVLLADPRSERYAAKDFVLIKNCLQDIELPAAAVAPLCPHLLPERDLHFCMQIKRQFKILKPQVWSREQKRWLVGFSRCSTNMPVHVWFIWCQPDRDSTQRHLFLEWYLATWPGLCQLLALEVDSSGMAETEDCGNNLGGCFNVASM